MYSLVLFVFLLVCFCVTCFNTCVEYDIPELAAYTKSNGSELVVMLHMVSLHFLEVTTLWVCNVCPVVNRVIAQVATNNSHWYNIKVLIRKNHVKWYKEKNCCNYITCDRGHHKSVLVLWEWVMNSMDHKVKGVNVFIEWDYSHPGIFSMEKESVKHVLHEEPVEKC